LRLQDSAEAVSDKEASAMWGFRLIPDAPV
jgi:hypothetical protein